MKVKTLNGVQYANIVAKFRDDRESLLEASKALEALSETGLDFPKLTAAGWVLERVVHDLSQLEGRRFPRNRYILISRGRIGGVGLLVSLEDEKGARHKETVFVYAVVRTIPGSDIKIVVGDP